MAHCDAGKLNLDNEADPGSRGASHLRPRHTREGRGSTTKGVRLDASKA